MSIVGFLVDAAVTGRPSWSVLQSLLLFFHNYQMAYANGELSAWPVGRLWTISVEMQFYLIYGLALPVLSRRHLTALLLAFLVVSPILRLIATVILPHTLDSDLSMAYAIYSGSIFQFDSFAAGALVALHRPFFSSPRAAGRLFAMGSCALLVYALAYIIVNITVRHDTGSGALRNVISGILYGEYRQVFLYSAVAAASAGLVAMAASGHGALRLVLARPSFQWIGTISYGAYIYHGVALVACGYVLGVVFDPISGGPVRLIRDVLLFASAYPLTLTIAHISYRYLEAPIIRGVHGWLRRDSSGSATAGA